VCYFLKTFLSYKNVDIPLEESVENLFKECKKIEPAFNELKLDVLYHPMDEEDVWMDIKTCNEFIAHAKQTKELIESFRTVK